MNPQTLTEVDFLWRFDEFELRLFGEVKWEVSEDTWDTWDRMGRELSAIPRLAFVGCAGERLVS